MNRKEFLRGGFLSRGKAILEPVSLVPSADVSSPPPRDGVARPVNDRCLAQRGGCFTCTERCPEQAIDIAIGTGIVVDAERCTGCGVCADACPLFPAAIRVVPQPS